MRYYLFLDESGEACVNKPDPRFDVFVLCGVLFREDHYAQFDACMKAIKLDLFGNSEIVFHSYEMRAQKEAFIAFRDKTFLRKFYERIEKLYNESEYTVFAAVIHKGKYKAIYPEKNQAYEEALKFICERVAIKVGTANHTDSIHLCIESREVGKDRLLKKYYASFRRFGTEYCSTEALLKFNETLNFRGKLQKVSGLEFADLCAYPIAAKMLHPERPQPTYELMKSKIGQSYNGRTDGIGIKQFP